jgi:acyl carrier protein
MWSLSTFRKLADLMVEETVTEQTAELLRQLTDALAQADSLDLIDVAIRISEAIDLLELIGNYGRP